MIGAKDKVIQVHAHPPDDDVQAKIEWICHDPPHLESEASCTDGEQTVSERMV